MVWVGTERILVLPSDAAGGQVDNHSGMPCQESVQDWLPVFALPLHCKAFLERHGGLAW
jgi:hypothetical protein